MRAEGPTVVSSLLGKITKQCLLDSKIIRPLPLPLYFPPEVLTKGASTLMFLKRGIFKRQRSQRSNTNCFRVFRTITSNIRDSSSANTLFLPRVCLSLNLKGLNVVSTSQDDPHLWPFSRPNRVPNCRYVTEIFCVRVRPGIFHTQKETLAFLFICSIFPFDGNLNPTRISKGANPPSTFCWCTSENATSLPSVTKMNSLAKSRICWIGASHKSRFNTSNAPDQWLPLLFQTMQQGGILTIPWLKRA